MKVTIPVFAQLGVDPPTPSVDEFQMKPYKHSPAMKAALARAREAQPPLISLAATTVTDTTKEWMR